MRLGVPAILAGAALLCSCASSNTADDRAEIWSSFLEYRGSDLQRSDEGTRERAATLLAELIPERVRADEYRWGLATWRVASVGSGASAAVVVFEGWHIPTVPGVSSARTHVFSPTGAHLSSVSFWTGWRIDIGGVAISDSPHGFPLIDLTSGPKFKGRDVRHQLYSVIDGRVALLRLEGPNGESLNNNYIVPNATIGPPVPERSLEAWEAALQSENPAEVLRTLFWLGGEHDVEGRSYVTEEDRVVLVAGLRKSERVRKSIAALEGSSDPWIREAARMALDEESRAK